MGSLRRSAASAGLRVWLVLLRLSGAPWCVVAGTASVFPLAEAYVTLTHEEELAGPLALAVSAIAFLVSVAVLAVSWGTRRGQARVCTIVLAALFLAVVGGVVHGMSSSTGSGSTMASASGAPGQGTQSTHHQQGGKTIKTGKTRTPNTGKSETPKIGAANPASGSGSASSTPSTSGATGSSPHGSRPRSGPSTTPGSSGSGSNNTPRPTATATPSPDSAGAHSSNWHVQECHEDRRWDSRGHLRHMWKTCRWESGTGGAQAPASASPTAATTPTPPAVATPTPTSTPSATPAPAAPPAAPSPAGGGQSRGTGGVAAP